MIDRLADLKRLTGQKIDTTSDRDSDQNINNQYQIENQHQAIDDDFFQDIKTVRQCILVLNKNNHKIKQLKRQYGTAVMETKQKEARNEMTKIVVENTDMQKKIKKNISDLQDRVAYAQKNQPDEPQTKMKKNYCASLAKQVTQVLKKQQSIQDQFKSQMKKKIRRQIQHVQPNLDQQQIEEYVQNPDLAQQMLQKKIYGQASVSLNNRVSDIQDKYRDIKKLQASVNQCVQLFNQLSNLVYAQGQKIDSIEANVADSKNYVQKGQKKLKQAKEHHKCSRKCLCFLIIGGLILLIIIVIIVVATKN